MKNTQLLLINDMCGYGKVALSAMLPVLSHMGYRIHNLPTALVSDTLNYPKFYIHDTTEYVRQSLAIWEDLGFEFDAISTGFIVTEEETRIISDFCHRRAQKGTKVFVDPIMGDNGKLYTGFDTAFAQKMRKLCQKADITVPNITETSYLLEIPFLESYSVENIEDIFKRFVALNIKNAVVTGIPLENGKIGCAFCEKGNIAVLENDRVEGMYHGTGDVFASAFLGAFMKNGDIYKSVALAQQYVYDCILRTKERCGTSHYGIDFEPLIGDFCESLQKL